MAVQKTQFLKLNENDKRNQEFRNLQKIALGNKENTNKFKKIKKNKLLLF